MSGWLSIISLTSKIVGNSDFTTGIFSAVVGETALLRQQYVSLSLRLIPERCAEAAEKVNRA
jgi:hypothetical protein